MNKPERKLKIGLDYHGVINDNPKYFKELCSEVIRRGHELHIITGGPKSTVIKQLAQENIVYTELFTIIDYYAAQGIVSYTEDGNFYLDDKLWNTAKAHYCSEYKIDVQIDDSLIYGEYFTTPYCLYEGNSQSCTLSLKGTVIDLHTLPPKQTIDLLEKLLK